LGAAAVLLAWVVVGTANVPRPFHPSDANCGQCHLAGSQVSDENAHRLLASQEKLCGRCHSNAIEVSHPSGVSPRSAVPDDYPLDWKGDMTCSTCHNVHTGGQGLLRGARRGPDLCMACHDASFFSAMADGGISVSRSGHLDASTRQFAERLDGYSRQCLTCHFEYESSQDVSIDRRGLLRHAGGGVSHPIGVEYSAAARKGLYRQAGQLGEGVLLPDGKVACVSCHRGYAKEHGALVASSHGRDLCMECHNL
jgi:predicted CXXCH cytochrome family protein